jgi:hypothetical protein
MTWNNPPDIDATPDAVTAAIDAINARLRWPGHSPEPCAGHMVYEHQLIAGIDVVEGALVEFRIAGVIVGVGNHWGGIGNAAVRCLLPHTSHLTDTYVTALNQGGALNAVQLHLLTSHGTHNDGCRSFRRDRWCRICRAGRAI